MEMLELAVSAPSRDDALQAVRDAVAAAGADHLFTFHETTATGHRPAGERPRQP